MKSGSKQHNRKSQFLMEARPCLFLGRNGTVREVFVDELDPAVQFLHSADTHNWLQVLGATELAQIDQRVRHQFHAIVPLLDTFKS